MYTCVVTRTDIMEKYEHLILLHILHNNIVKENIVNAADWFVAPIACNLAGKIVCRATRRRRQ